MEVTLVVVEVGIICHPSPAPPPVHGIEFLYAIIIEHL